MKKIIALVLCVLLLTPCVSVYATASAPTDSDPFILEFDGEDVTDYLYYEPIVGEDGEVYFAMEDLLEMLELYYSVEYDEETNTMSIYDERMGLDDDDFMAELEEFMPYSNLDYDAYMSDEYYVDGIREAFSVAKPEAALLFFIADFLYWLDDDMDSSELWDLWDMLFGFGSEGEGEGGDDGEIIIDDEEISTGGEASFGDVFSFLDFEITVGDGFELVVYEDDYPEELTGETLVRIPMTITNTSGSTIDVSYDLDYILFGARGAEIDDISSNLDDSIYNVGRLRRGGSVDTYFYIPYEGDGEYVIEFYDYWTDEVYTDVIIPVSEANAQ